MTSNPSILSIERLAEVVAYEQEYPLESHATIWQRLGTSEEAVGASRAHWAREIASEIADGVPSLAARFGRTYLKTRRAVGLRRPLPGEVVPDRALDVPTMEPPARQRRQPAALPVAIVDGERAKEVPSYLQPPPKHRVMRDLPEVPTAQDHAASQLGAAPPEVFGNETAMTPMSPELLARLKAESDPLLAMQRAAARMPQSAEISSSPAAPQPQGASDPIGGGTVIAPINIAGSPPEALPFQKHSSGAGSAERTRIRPEDVDLSLFPLEKYAEISGALARGDARSTVLAKYRLTDDFYDALGMAWGARFQREPELGERYMEMARREARTKRIS